MIGARAMEKNRALNGGSPAGKQSGLSAMDIFSRLCSSGPSHPGKHVLALVSFFALFLRKKFDFFLFQMYLVTCFWLESQN